MERKEMIDVLVRTHRLIHGHHATNLCNSDALYKQSDRVLAVIQQLRNEEREVHHD